MSTLHALGLGLAAGLFASCSPVTQRAPVEPTPTEPTRAPNAPPSTAAPEEVAAPIEADACTLPDDAVEGAVATVLDEAHGAPRPAVSAPPWDRTSTPKYFERVVAELGLTAPERDVLFRNGFVVPERLSLGNYGFALHEIHRRELPLYLSADAVLHALFGAHEQRLAAHEVALDATLREALEKMHAALPVAAAAYAPEVAADVDLYLDVARSLGGDTTDGYFGMAAEATRLTQAAERATGVETVVLFGRPRVVDWSAYRPRGHYADYGHETYFRMFTWLSHLAWNVVSRGGRSSAPDPDPRETPREAAVALALADLAGRAGVLAEVVDVAQGLAALVGPGDGVPLTELARVAALVPDLRDVHGAAATLRREVGDRFQRSFAYQPMPWLSGDLPAIASFLPEGTTADGPALAYLSRAGTPWTRLVRAPELAVALGNDRALAYLDATDGLDTLALDARRRLRSAAPRSDLYATWLDAVRALGDRAPGVEPSFMATPAFGDARLASTLVAYGQLRHAYVLYAAQAYDYAGCEIPDAWVEPALPVYDALLAYAASASAASERLWGQDERDFDRSFADIVGALRAIAVDELAGRALSASQLRLLRLVAEYSPPGTYDGRTRPPAKFNGWYPRLFPDRKGAFRRGSFVSDVASSPTQGAVVYLGATEPRIGLFVVDVGGEPRLMVGPVARAFERAEPLGTRLDDRSVRDYLPPTLAAWERSYLVRGPAAPDVMLQTFDGHLALSGDPRTGPVTLEQLDAHGDAILTVTVTPDRESPPALPFDLGAGRDYTPGRVRVRLPDGSAWEEGFGWGRFDDMLDPPDGEP